MDEEIKGRWVTALRSGKYRQGQGRLRRENETFCCLGVLCDIVAPDRWGKVDDDSFQYGVNNDIILEQSGDPFERKRARAAAVEECIDQIACSLDAILLVEPDITAEATGTILERKCQKWQRRYAAAIDGDRSIA
jgi:hypothetical protein